MTVKVMEHTNQKTHFKLRFEPSGLPPLNKIIIPDVLEREASI
jgi:hypothetical protein